MSSSRRSILSARNQFVNADTFKFCLDKITSSDIHETRNSLSLSFMYSRKEIRYW